MSKRELTLAVDRGNKLIVEEVMDEAMAFVHLDDNIEATILGQIASVVLQSGLALIVTAVVPKPPITSITVVIRNREGFSQRTTSLGEIPVTDLLNVKEVEFRYFMAPMCRVMG